MKKHPKMSKCTSACSLCGCFSLNTERSQRRRASPADPSRCGPNNMMSRQPRTSSTQLTSPRRPPRDPAHRSEEKKQRWKARCLHSLGLISVCPQGLAFKAAEQREIREQLGGAGIRARWSKLNHCPRNSRVYFQHWGPDDG